MLGIGNSLEKVGLLEILFGQIIHAVRRVLYAISKILHGKINLIVNVNGFSRLFLTFYTFISTICNLTLRRTVNQIQWRQLITLLNYKRIFNVWNLS